MNILLVRPRPDRRSFNLQSLMILEPLELEIVAAHLQELGHTVDLVDLILERRPLTWFLKVTSYDIVALAGHTIQPHVAKELANDAKRVSPETMVVLGGVNAELSPTDFVDPAIDHILWANCVLTIGEIASGLPAAEAACLPGVWGSGKVRPTALHPAGMLPDRTVTAHYRNRYSCIYHIPCATVQTSYGCPSTCRFCFCTQIAPYTERDLDEVMDEFQQITEAHVLIVDDDFLSGPDRVRAFCNALDARSVRKRFVAFGRAEYVVKNPGDIAMLAEHGLDALFMSIEPHRAEKPSDEDKGTSSDQNVRAVRILEAAGVQCYSGLTTGVDWGRADFAGLAGFINQFDHPMVNVQPITPLPGTPPHIDEQGHLALRRITAERWDMAHLAFRPTALSPRAYCWELLKTYYRTSASSSQLRYIRRRYGNRVYRRVLRVAVTMTGHYVKLIVRPL